MSRQILVVFLIFAVANSAFGTAVTPCGGIATLNSVDVEGCEDGVNGRCRFVKGSSYRITVDSTNTAAGVTATALPYTAKALILGVNLTLFSGNACESLVTGNCPVEEGENIVFSQIYDITNTYPALNSRLTIEVKDNNNQVAVCAQFQFALVNP